MQRSPTSSITVFAGQDREATEKARSYFGGHPPTSPAIAILRDGKLVYLMQRFVIEGATAPAHRPGTGPRLQRILRRSHDGISVHAHDASGARHCAGLFCSRCIASRGISGSCLREEAACGDAAREREMPGIA